MDLFWYQLWIHSFQCNCKLIKAKSIYKFGIDFGLGKISERKNGREKKKLIDIQKKKRNAVANDKVPTYGLITYNLLMVSVANAEHISRKKRKTVSLEKL